ncbi:glycosyltransferase 6-like [Alnus glutinosa]|uniref:glycosyltransferase 6-like n=1 Tax=Alnus glutinosa TaxID=3517 RepID=UPI002D783578|nr:glycosyltransferase 6-like [Alnus glutinosa]
MAPKPTFPNKACASLSYASLFLVGSLLLLLLLLCPFRSFLNPNPYFGSNLTEPNVPDPPDPNFYDDPELTYSVDKTVKNWDEKRSHWLKRHPSLAAGSRNRILVITGSQASPCKNPIGDHLLLRLFKNKLDYCRIHGYDLFYNNAYLHPKMNSYWAKLPVVRAAMIAHPEAEWIWWVDSDAVFTDMEFKLPLDRYKAHNLVVHGWPNMVYEDKDNKSWTGLNAGVFLIRNCQWAMDLIDIWASMGPKSPNYEKWGHVLQMTFKDKPFPLPDDQSSLIYLLFTNKPKWGDKTYLESEYYFQGYWIGLVKMYDNIAKRYTKIDIHTPILRRRHAEKLSEYYAALREPYLENAGYESGNGKRPFVTHFTGCQPCNGEHNPLYAGDMCWNEIQRALNFADNQVLRKYGFVHPDLLNPSLVAPLPFDYPA